MEHLGHDFNDEERQYKKRELERNNNLDAFNSWFKAVEEALSGAPFKVTARDIAGIKECIMGTANDNGLTLY